MGDIVVNMGQYGAILTPWLASRLPEETVSAAPSDAAEIVVTLGTGVAPLVPLLLPGVRWVHVLGTGIDGVPRDAIGDRILTCSRGASALAISEFVLAAMLCFEKQLPGTWISEPPEHWNTNASLGSLHGRTLGVIGLGAIGTQVATRALAFGMRVLAVRRSSSDGPTGVQTDTLDAVLAAADHLVIAAPATPATYHLLDAAAFARCKRGVHLVNVARGTLVDQDALRAALDDGTVATASLDVVDPEPLPAGHWLYAHPQVRLSPHVSWSSPTTMATTIDMFVDNVRRYRAGDPLTGVVTRDY